MLQRLLITSLLSLFIGSSALAQGPDQTPIQDANWDSPDTPDGSYPVNYTQRPIVLPRLVARGDLNFVIQRVSFMGFSDTAAGLNIGGAFGIIDNLEAGISSERIGLRRASGLIPLQLTPDFDYGDPYLYARYRFLATDSFEMGGELGFIIPFNTNFGFIAAVPFRLRVGEIFSLDGGLEFEGILFENGLGENEFLPNLHIVVQPRIAPIENVFVGIDTGLSIFDFDGDQMRIPLGFVAGYVLDIAPTRIDLFGEFAFPAFIQTGPGDTIITELYQITFGARAYLDFN